MTKRKARRTRRNPTNTGMNNLMRLTTDTIAIGVTARVGAGLMAVL